VLLLLLYDSFILQRLKEHQESSSELYKVTHSFLIDCGPLKRLQRLTAGGQNKNLQQVIQVGA